MHLKRWFFRAGVVLGAIVVYRLVARRRPHIAQAPAYTPPPRPAFATPSQDLRDIVANTVKRETVTTPLAAAMATAVADLEQDEHTSAREEAAASTPVIGNAHKMVYHLATDAHLPLEENRVYFASEEAALAAGYRKAERLA